MKVPLPDEQEELIHNYILHTYLLNILESDLKTITNACFKIHEPYFKLVEETLRKIRIKVRDMKVELRKNKMKIEEPFLDNVDFWQYDYYARGYHGFKRYWEPALKMHSTNLLDEYFRSSQ
ncbi:hypothetical protein WQ54_15220 [Bacillus sp. SA1-12]|uniref:hypothetical protein n=1 Tax=Bacillus sp. SA1-12 TaxID=1455638 RepID=UPI000626B703|nr:hypothetical protein [Bacillus sp. SA1-12]KKI91372.1 hypothetical protein WQ54_15220 [Bacillus sp. SA1-12]